KEAREDLRMKEAAVDQSLRLARERAEELERRLQRTEEDLATARAAGAEHVDPAEHRRLQRKVERLQAMIAEGHDERTELRRALAAASIAHPAPPADPEVKAAPAALD